MRILPAKYISSIEISGCRFSGVLWRRQGNITDGDAPVLLESGTSNVHPHAVIVAGQPVLNLAQNFVVEPKVEISANHERSTDRRGTGPIEK